MKSLKIFFSATICMASLSASSSADLVLDYTDGSPVIGWQLPKPQGATNMAMFFTNQTAVACTLKTVHAGLIDDPDFFNDTTGDLFFTIYTADAAGFPDSLLYFESIPNAVFADGFNQPINVVSLDLSAFGLTFPTGGQWVVGVATDQQSVSKGDVLIFASDQGTKPSLRWLEYTASAGWQRADCCHDSIDVNMHIYSTISTPLQNQPPVMVDVTDKFVNEGDLLEFSVTASDSNSGDYVSMTMQSPDLPIEANFSQLPNSSGLGVFSWETGFDDAGDYTAIFTATDIAGESDAVTIKITVNNVNRLPVLKSTPDQFVDENATLNFGISATDLDGDAVALSMTSPDLPAAASFTDLGGGFGEFNWSTDYFNAGNYTAIIIADDGNGGTDEVTVNITVNNVAQPPIITPIGDKAVDENGLLEFDVFAIDSDDDPILLGITKDNLPPEATFSQSRSTAQGTFSWDTDFADSGTYFAVFGAFDGKDISTDSISITVQNVLCADLTVDNFSLTGPPFVSKGINLSNRLFTSVTNIGETNFNDSVFVGFYISTDSVINVSDGLLFGGRESLGQVLQGAIVNLPGGGIIPTGYLNGPAYLGFIIDEFDDAAECNEANNTAFIPVNVVLNVPPILDPINDTTIAEGASLALFISGSEPDGESFGFEISDQPVGSSFSDNGDGTASFDWTPGFDQAGVYDVTFRIVDAREGSDEQLVRIIVNNINRPPVLNSIGNRTTTENQNLNFGVSATDLDGTTSALTTSILPAGATFFYNLDGTGTFDWTPNFSDSGTYNVIFYASDGSLVDSEMVQIAVKNVNRPPQLNPIGDTVIAENQLLHLDITAIDPDGGELTIEAINRPNGSVFNDFGNGTASFDWTPNFDQSSDYDIFFTVTDDNNAADFDSVNIIVTDVNRPPVLAD
ncbi:MAG: Ig-like domain-containing protein, partial [Candidatus Zixiibacteriota bacterium]